MVIVDEISTANEARAVANIAQRGVSLVATAHGHNLRDLLGNEQLKNLLGGFQTVILSDAALR